MGKLAAEVIYAAIAYSGAPTLTTLQLRNRIWEYTLIHDEPLHARHNKGQYVFDLQSGAALLDTCKQTREECFGMFYANNAFKLACRTSESRSRHAENINTVIKTFCDGRPVRKVVVSSDLRLWEPPIYVDYRWVKDEILGHIYIMRKMRDWSGRLDELKLDFDITWQSKTEPGFMITIDAFRYEESLEEATEKVEKTILSLDRLGLLGRSRALRLQIGILKSLGTRSTDDRDLMSP